MDLDRAIDEFIAAGARLGVPEPSAPADRSSLDQLEAEIAPLRLPPSVQRFWERIDTKSLHAIAPMPAIDPDFALWMWKQSRDEFAAQQPLALLTIGYESHGCTSIELDQDGFEGGAIFEWDLVDGGFKRKFNDFADWLQFQTDALNSGNFDEARATADGGRMLSIPGSTEFDAYQELSAPSHPFYGDQALIERDIMGWPEHWRALAGVTAESARPRGATHSIAELLSIDPTTDATVTVVAKVVALAGSSAGETARVDDGTGQLVIHCPPNSTALGPVISETFEFDVVVPAGDRLAAVDPKTADDGPESQFVAQFAQPVDAIATAIRRT